MRVCMVVTSYRLLLQEVARIENHMLNIACHAGDIGCLLALLVLVLATHVEWCIHVHSRYMVWWATM